MRHITEASHQHAARGALWAGAAALSFVALELTVRAVAHQVDANAGAFVRICPLFLLSWVVVLLRPGDRKSLRALFLRHDVLIVGALGLDGLCNLYLGNALKLSALQHGSIVVTLTTIEVGNLVGATLLAWWWMGQSVSRRMWGGILVIIVGTLVASLSRGGQGTVGVTMALALAAGLSFAMAASAMGLALRRGVTLWAALALSSTVGMVITAGATILSHQAPDVMAVLTEGGPTRSYLVLSGLAYAMALICLTGAFQRLPVASANAIAGTNGPVAALAGGLIFGPLVTSLTVAGVALVLVGAYVVRMPGVPGARRPGMSRTSPGG